MIGGGDDCMLVVKWRHACGLGHMVLPQYPSPTPTQYQQPPLQHSPLSNTTPSPTPPPPLNHPLLSTTPSCHTGVVVGQRPVGVPGAHAGDGGV